MRERVLLFDLLRCVAAIAVIAIHVLAPYRDGLGVIPFDHWVTAVSVNSVTRWAVPVFILISGALMLSDERPFNASYYVRRRLGKVLIPFLVWSLFYAYLSGWTAQGYDPELSKEVLKHSPEHATYYHLGFFYYFIPLYFVVPFLQLMVQRLDTSAIVAFTLVWLVTTACYLFRIDGPWSHELWLYTGYLTLGYLLYKKVPLKGWIITTFILLGSAALVWTVFMVVMNSIEADHYTVGRWLSYKTINVVLAASMIFMCCKQIGNIFSERTQSIIRFISKHSLGIYLLHPIFLWPMKAYGWHQGHPVWVIPLWVILSGAGALLFSWLLGRSQKTRWLLP